MQLVGQMIEGHARFLARHAMWAEKSVMQNNTKKGKKCSCWESNLPCAGPAAVRTTGRIYFCNCLGKGSISQQQLCTVMAVEKRL